MEDCSFFTEKKIIPNKSDLAEVLGQNHKLWISVCDYTISKYLDGKHEWNYPGQKYGWNFRIKDKRRAIIYLLPRKLYFKVAFVFGDKAVNEIMLSDISDDIKNELAMAKKYAEGRGIRIEIKNENRLKDIEKLIAIKLKY